MTTPSLQKIVAVENELYAAEQAEQQAADLWLEERKAEILAAHEGQLAELDRAGRTVREEAVRKAEQRAAAIIEAAEREAAALAALKDDLLNRILRRHLVGIITGRSP